MSLNFMVCGMYVDKNRDQRVKAPRIGAKDSKPQAKAVSGSGMSWRQRWRKLDALTVWLALVTGCCQ